MGEQTVFLDIETIPSQSPALLDKLRAEVKAPGNLKKADSIDAWLAENRDRAAAEALAKTSFDPAHGHICTIAWAIDGNEPQVVHAFDVEQEASVLHAFFAAIDTHHRKTFVGHYISGFDLRFVLCRAVVLGVPIPACIPRDPKPWDGRVFDTMTAWAGARGSISLDALCEALGVEGKDGFDGSMIADAWAAGEHARIAEYCAADVERVRAVWKRFVAANWTPGAELEAAA